MDVSLQDFAHYLAAPAGAMSRDETAMCLITEEDSDLIEKLWTGTEVSDQVFIASGVKKSTPAVYLCNANVRRVAFLDSLETLQCYQYDEEEEEWTRIASFPSFPVHTETQLSGCFDSENRSILFFQDISGQLQGVSISMTGEVRSGFPLPPTGSDQSPLIHSAFTSDNMISHLLFIGQDGEVCDLTLDAAGEKWQVVRRLKLGKYHISRFMVTGTDDTAPLEILALSSTGMLILINEMGQPAELGTITGDRFVAVTSRECAAEIVVKGKGIIKQLAGSKK